MNTSIPFASVLLQDMVGTPQMRRVWTEENTVGKWIMVSRALVEAQEELGLIPGAAAHAILRCLTAERLTIESIRGKQQAHVHLMVSFLKAFREACGEPAEHFYIGPTTQDILDTALTLQMIEAHEIILGQMTQLEDSLCERALEHRNTIVMGRSHQQHTVPTTFGFVLATWGGEIADHVDRARESEKRWCFGNLSGISGAQNAFVELADAETARRLQERFCAGLGLGVPAIDMHTRIDRFAEVVSHLAELCSSLGKIGANLVAWQRSEVMEFEAPYSAEQHSSSTSPNKVNPESSEHVQGLAMLTRGLAHALLEVQVLDNRDGTRMPVEFVSIPLTYLMVSRALATTDNNIRGSRVHRETMLRNLDHPNVLGQAAAERIMIELYRKTGRRDWAHTILHRCAADSRDQRRPFIEILRQDPELTELLSPADLDRLCDLEGYTGTAGQQTEDAVANIRGRRHTR